MKKVERGCLLLTEPFSRYDNTWGPQKQIRHTFHCVKRWFSYRRNNCSVFFQHDRPNFAENKDAVCMWTLNTRSYWICVLSNIKKTKKVKSVLTLEPRQLVFSTTKKGKKRQSELYRAKLSIPGTKTNTDRFWWKRYILRCKSRRIATTERKKPLIDSRAFSTKQNLPQPNLNQKITDSLGKKLKSLKLSLAEEKS